MASTAASVGCTSTHCSATPSTPPIRPPWRGSVVRRRPRPRSWRRSRSSSPRCSRSMATGSRNGRRAIPRWRSTPTISTISADAPGTRARRRSRRCSGFSRTCSQGHSGSTARWSTATSSSRRPCPRTASRPTSPRDRSTRCSRAPTGRYGAPRGRAMPMGTSRCAARSPRTSRARSSRRCSRRASAATSRRLPRPSRARTCHPPSSTT